MKMIKKLLLPALMLSTVFGGAAMAQEKATLPDAPVPQNWTLQPGTTSTKLDLSARPFTYHRNDGSEFRYTVPAPPNSNEGFFGSGTIGRLAGYFDRHTNDSQPPFDFMMEYQVKGPFSIRAGTLSNPLTHSGKAQADRIAIRSMTGLPDWETQNLRQIMSPVPGNNHRGSDGFAIGLKIELGPRR